MSKDIIDALVAFADDLKAHGLKPPDTILLRTREDGENFLNSAHRRILDGHPTLVLEVPPVAQRVDDYDEATIMGIRIVWPAPPQKVKMAGTELKAPQGKF